MGVEMGRYEVNLGFVLEMEYIVFVDRLDVMGEGEKKIRFYYMICGFVFNSWVYGGIRIWNDKN